MIEYDALLNGVIDCFSFAISKSDGTDLDMLRQFDILMFKRLAMLDPKDTYKPHAELLGKLNYKSNWGHKLNNLTLRTAPRSVQKGVIYVGHGKTLGNWKHTEYVSFLVQKPHDSFLYLRVTYCPDKLTIEKLYCCKVSKIKDTAFEQYSIEGSIPETLDLLYGFSK